MKKPTTQQARVLHALASGANPRGHVLSMSASGGFTATWASLYRNGWRTADGEITEQGRAAIGLPPSNA